MSRKQYGYPQQRLNSSLIPKLSAQLGIHSNNEDGVVMVLRSGPITYQSCASNCNNKIKEGLKTSFLTR